MKFFLYLIPYLIVFIVDRVQKVRGISNPTTWRWYAGIAVTALVAWIVDAHIEGTWGYVAYFAVWAVGYPASYIWNNSADTTF